MIKTDISVKIDYTSDDLKNAVISRLPIKKEELGDVKILKRTLRISEETIEYKMTVALSLSEEREHGLLKIRNKVFPAEEFYFDVVKSKLPSRPIVVGSGPCGLFAALVLAEAGASPIILERGLDVDARNKKVRDFERFALLDPECNVQFGEGGAGTYSDGKLKAGSLDKYKMKVLSEFVSAGGAEDILYSSTAHLGTDKLRSIVKSLREKIKSLGGEFIFSACLTDIKVKNGRIYSAIYKKDGVEYEVLSDNIILAHGHSARDTFVMLKKLGVPMKSKGFGVGVRIEHPRESVDKMVYGKHYKDGLESASYHLVTHLNNGRSVYSFCMCPGGSVVAAASENSGIVTNGMSEYLRDGENSNAAFLVSVTPEDFAGDDSLAGVELQRKIERAAFLAAGASYKAPSQSMGSFLSGNIKDAGADSLPSTYPIGTETVSTEEYMPDFITDSLRLAIPDFDAWMPGFLNPSAVLTGPETRTTSPVRILRNSAFEVPEFSGLYPAGEGAGYAGGIVSSAVDGIKCAEALLLKYLR